MELHAPGANDTRHSPNPQFRLSTIAGRGNQIVKKIPYYIGCPKSQMNSSCRLTLALLALVGAASAQQLASVSGLVLDAADRSPLGGVRVQLFLAAENSLFYGALTDDKGQFSIPAMAPGLYAVAPRRAGLVLHVIETPALPLPVVQLKAGQNLEVRLTMIPKAVISGRVTDDAGLPVDGAVIMIEGADPAGEMAVSFHQEIYQNRAQVQTDARGEFRMSVRPGKFHVKAIMPTGERAFGTAVANPGLLSDTYFPSATSAKSAQVVETQPGRETANISVTLIRKGALAISGTVSNMRSANATVSAVAAHGSVWQTAPSDSTGRFTIRNLQPETYRVYATSDSNGERTRSASVEAKLADRDLTGLNLILGQSVRLAGHVEASEGASVSKITLSPVYPSGEAVAVPVNANGDFEVEKVPAESYNMLIDSKSKNAYVKAAVLNGTPVSDLVIDLTANGGQLKITVVNGANISGVVTTGDGLPVTHRLSSVSLVPLAKKLKDAKPAPVDEHGAYSIFAIPPGKYRLFALDILSMAGLFGKDDEFEALAARGETIEISGTAEIVKNLKVLAPEGTAK